MLMFDSLKQKLSGKGPSEVFFGTWSLFTNEKRPMNIYIDFVVLWILLHLTYGVVTISRLL